MLDRPRQKNFAVALIGRKGQVAFSSRHDALTAEICLWARLLSYLRDMLRNREVRYKQLYLDRSKRLPHSALAFGSNVYQAIGCFFALAFKMLEINLKMI